MTTRRLVLLPILLSGLATAPALAHPSAGHEILGGPGHDKPGPPPIVTSVDLSTVTHPDMDDGGGDAEVLLSIAIEHTGHGSVYPTISEPDLDFDATGGTWVIGRVLYVHRECTPMEAIKITVRGTEFDSSNLDEIESALVSIAGGLAERVTGITSELLTRIVTELLATLNPDDSLGEGTVTATGPGTWYVTTSGGDYSITAEFIVYAIPVEGTECDPDSIPPEDPPPGICYIGTTFYDSLLVAYPEADSVFVESGDPGQVSPADLADAKTSIRTCIVEMGRWTAIDMIERAWGYEGSQQAWNDYQFGLSEGISLSAIHWYKIAFCEAHAALVNEIPDPFPVSMPRSTSGVPTFIATQMGRTSSYLIGAHGQGTHAATVTSITGGPPGAVFTLEPADPAHPSRQFLHVTQTGPAGRYTIQVKYDDGTFADVPLPTLFLTLDVDFATVATGVESESPVAAPVSYAVRFLGANPDRGSGAIGLDLPEDATITLALYDVTGERVVVFAENEGREAGHHSFALDGERLPSGVYYARMSARPMRDGGQEFEAMEKIVIVR